MLIKINGLIIWYYDGEMQGVKYDFGLTITGDGYPVIGIGNQIEQIIIRIIAWA